MARECDVTVIGYYPNRYDNLIIGSFDTGKHFCFIFGQIFVNMGLILAKSKIVGPLTSGFNMRL